MRRARSSGPRTPEEALEGLSSLETGQRNMLVDGMLKLRDQADHLDRMSNPETLPSRKEYERNLTVARAALARLTRVFNRPLGRDLISMEIKDVAQSAHYPDGRPVQRFPVKRFLDLLPMVKARFDAVTNDDIRTRGWPIDPIELRRDKDFTLAYCALDLANGVGLLPGAFRRTSEIEDPPRGKTLDVVARILSFAEREWLDIDTVRKRFPSKKQMESVGHTLPETFRGE
jgi:hypothetical protein